MGVERTELEVGDERFPGRLNVPTGETEGGVVCLPGAGHGPYGDVFDRVARAIAERGRCFLRYESWRSQEDIRRKTLRELHDELDAAIEYLRSRGCGTVSVLGKSFGGGIVLTYLPGAAERAVLWAPAVQFGDGSNVESVYDTPLGEADRLRLGPSELDAVDIPVRVLHGDEDEAVLLGNSRRIVDGLPSGEPVEIEGGDHSFVGEAFEGVVADETVDFLTT